jgi:hypothetical protein
LTVELVEESILADTARTHRRRKLADGTVFDLTAYDEFGVLVSFRLRSNEDIQFIDFKIYDPA